MESRNKWKLRDVILEYSESQDFASAAREWDPVWYDEDPTCDSECICGKKHIKELNAIKNRKNGTELIVGSECVNYFMEDLDTTNIFARLTELKSDITLPMTPKLLTAIEKLKILNNWDLAFYKNTQRKRSLNDKQLAKRISINRKVLSALAARKRGTERFKKANSILTDAEVKDMLTK